MTILFQIIFLIYDQYHQHLTNTMTSELLNIDGTAVAHTIVPIIGDGACLFRAISYLMYDTQVMASEVREQIVSHVVANWEEFAVLSHDSNGDNYSSATEYFADMSRPFTYGSLCELMAAAKLFPWIFEVYRNNELYMRLGTDGNPGKKRELAGKL